MIKNIPEKNNNLSQNTDRGLRLWLPWIIALMVGLIGWSYLDSTNDGRLLSISKSQSLANRFESSASLLNSQAILASYANSQAIENISSIRRNLQSDMTLLQRGGYISSSDPIPALALSSYPQIPLQQVNSQYEKFDSSIQSIVAISDQLQRAAQAQESMPQSLEKARTTTGQISQSNTLSSGAWRDALAPSIEDITASQLNNIDVIFSPTEGGYDLARQWASTLLMRAREARDFNNLAQRDNSLSATDRQIIENFAQQTQSLALDARILVETYNARLQARQSLDDINDNFQSLQSSISNLNNSLLAMMANQNVYRYGTWLFIAISIVGLLGVLRCLWILGYQSFNVRSQNAQSAKVVSAVDKVVRQLRKIVNLESSTTKLNEDPDSPIFTLISLINQTLTQKEEASLLIQERAQDIQSTVFTLQGTNLDVLKKQEMQRKDLDVLSSQIQDLAEYLASACQQLDSVQTYVENSIDTAYKGSGVAQENLWKMESLRENTQGTSKRIKRLGESAQTIGASTDLIKEISRKIKVLALNIAVEASSHGEVGRNFTLLARELERLAQNADQAVKDIDNQINTIQTDAKETVSSMEEGTTDVVYSTKLSASSSGIFKNLDTSLNDAKNQLTKILEGLEGATLSLVKHTEETSKMIEDIFSQEEGVKQMSKKMESFKDIISDFRRWLLSLGKDI